MSVSLMLTNSPYVDSNVTAVQNNSFAGVGTWFASTFWAYENITVNRVMFYNGAITNPNNFTLRAGVGTFDRSIGAPVSVGGLGQSIIFSSSVDVTGLTANSNLILAIPDFQMTAGTKYWIGQQTVSSSGAFVYNSTLAPLNNTTPRFSSNMQIFRTTGAITKVEADGNRFTPYNWGYDSGNGVTVWYNPNPGGTTFASATGVSITNMVGFTFTHTTDFESIYVESVQILGRISEGTFPTGFGTTIYSLLYDTDGTTCTIGHTTSFYTGNTAQSARIVLPLGAWLNRNKLYHIAFAFLNSGSVNNTLVYNGMPYEWQTGLGFTSIYFTKAGGSASPVYTRDRIIPFGFFISKTRGHLQNSEGNIYVF